MSAFYNIRPAPLSDEFVCNQAYIADRSPYKINLVSGTYKTDEDTPWVLPVVKKAEAKLNQDETINHEYILPCGLPVFRRAATVLLLGEDSSAVKENRALGIQTISGSGGIRLGAEFLAHVLDKKIFYYSNPSFVNYARIFYSAGFILGKTYRYWDTQFHTLDSEGLLEDLRKAHEGSVIILQPCGHNPTGLDPNEEVWEKIGDIVVARKLFPFFDFAYQGFTTGDINKDAWVIRYFANRTLEFFCVQSFSRMFGMYGERIGNLCVVQKFPKSSDAVREEFVKLIIKAYECPPAFGARIIMTILNDQDLRTEWYDFILTFINSDHIMIFRLGCVDTMHARIAKMRKALYDNLHKLAKSGNWNSIIEQNGMYWYSGLTDIQIKVLAKIYHIYVSSSGRVSLCGLNSNNVNCVAIAISEVVSKYNDKTVEKKDVL